MLEIVCIIWLWRTNGRNALQKGQKPTKYHALTLILWFGLEILGVTAGAVASVMFFPNADPLIGAYMLGIAGAALGGFLSYQIAKHAPQGNYRPDEQSQQWSQNPWNQGQDGWGQNPWNQDGWGQNPWNQDSQWNQNNQWNQENDIWNKSPDDYRNRSETTYVYGQPNQQIEMLSRPATIRIVEEVGGYQGGQDAFYLNGFPICSLRPGSEYTFTTSNIRNTVTIGMPNHSVDEKEYIVRFVAAENGYVEIHARAGKLLPELFKNFASQ